MSGPCKKEEPGERRIPVGSVIPGPGTGGSGPTPGIHYMSAVSQERMTPEQFVYWLQGFFEITGTQALTERHVRIIKDHIAQVFEKHTPSYPPVGPSIGGGPVNVPYIIPPAPPGSSVFIC